MTCICGAIGEQIEWCRDLVQDPFTLGEHPVDFLSVPQNEWHHWDVNELEPAQCQIAAQHAYANANWEYVKAAGYIVGGVLATAAAFVAMVVLAGIIMNLGIELTIIIEFLGLAIIGESMIWVTLIAATGIFAIGAASTSLAVGTIGLVSGIWTKVFLPGFNNSIAYATELARQARQLEIAGARAS